MACQADAPATPREDVSFASPSSSVALGGGRRGHMAGLAAAAASPTPFDVSSVLGDAASAMSAHEFPSLRDYLFRDIVVAQHAKYDTEEETTRAETTLLREDVADFNPCAARITTIEQQLRTEGGTPQLLDDITMHDVCMMMNTHRAYFVTDPDTGVPDVARTLTSAPHALTLTLSPYVFNNVVGGPVPANVEHWVDEVTARIPSAGTPLPRGTPPIADDTVLSICRYDEIVPGQATVWSVVAERLLLFQPTTLLAPVLQVRRVHWTLAGVFIQRDMDTGVVSLTPFGADTLSRGADTLDLGLAASARFLVALTERALRAMQAQLPLLRDADAFHFVRGEEVFNLSRDVLVQRDGVICGYAAIAAMLSAVGKPPQVPAAGWHHSSAPSHWLPMANDVTQADCGLLREAVHFMSMAACRFPVREQLPPSTATATAFGSTYWTH